MSVLFQYPVIVWIVLRLFIAIAHSWRFSLIYLTVVYLFLKHLCLSCDITQKALVFAIS